MTFRSTALAVLLAVGLAGGSAQAQNKDFKIGVVASLTGAFAGPAADSVEGIKGWIKARGLPGKNIIFETRSAKGQLKRFAEIAKELVNLKVDVIFTGGTPAIRAAKRATTSSAPMAGSRRAIASWSTATASITTAVASTICSRWAASGCHLPRSSAH